jgi:hypothetical protein
LVALGVARPCPASVGAAVIPGPDRQAGWRQPRRARR